MKIKVCPVCDREMKGKFFCRHCKTLVRHPNYWDQSYELNEDRDPALKPNECNSHNHSRENRTGKIEKNYNRDYQRAAGENKSKTSLNGNTGSINSGAKKQSHGTGRTLVIVMIAAAVGFYLLIAPVFFAGVKSTGNGRKEKVPDGGSDINVGKSEETVWYTDYVTEDMKIDSNSEDEYIVTTYEMDLDTIAGIGLPCNSYEHYKATIKDVKGSIKKYIKENIPSQEPVYSEYSNNVLIVYESYVKDEITETTNFNTYCEWQMDEDYNDLIRITYDSVTKNISFITIYNEDKAVCQDIARFILGLVDKETDSSKWEKILDNEESGLTTYENTYISWDFSEDTTNLIYLSPASDCFEQGQ